MLLPVPNEARFLRAAERLDDANLSLPWERPHSCEGRAARVSERRAGLHSTLNHAHLVAGADHGLATRLAYDVQIR